MELFAIDHMFLKLYVILKGFSFDCQFFTKMLEILNLFKNAKL